jgi:hypothetical protein
MDRSYEDWVEQLHQLGLKNNWRTRTISNKDWKYYRLYTKWEQTSGNCQVQSIKRRTHSKQKMGTYNSKGRLRYGIQDSIGK